MEQKKMGGFGEEKPVTDDIRTLCDSLKGSIEEHLNKKFDAWEPISYKSQVVAGTNYLVKIKISDTEYVHAKIFKALPCNGGDVSLTSATAGYSEGDSL
jgi:cystatin-A/B